MAGPLLRPVWHLMHINVPFFRSFQVAVFTPFTHRHGAPERPLHVSSMKRRVPDGALGMRSRRRRACRPATPPLLPGTPQAALGSALAVRGGKGAQSGGLGPLHQHERSEVTIADKTRAPLAPDSILGGAGPAASPPSADGDGGTTWAAAGDPEAGALLRDAVTSSDAEGTLRSALGIESTAENLPGFRADATKDIVEPAPRVSPSSANVTGDGTLARSESTREKERMAAIFDVIRVPSEATGSPCRAAATGMSASSSWSVAAGASATSPEVPTDDGIA